MLSCVEYEKSFVTSAPGLSGFIGFTGSFSTGCTGLIERFSDAGCYKGDSNPRPSAP